jgi:FkbM family methyltransferase
VKSFQILIADALSSVAYLVQQTARRLYVTQQESRVRSWLEVNGDKTLRLDYDSLNDSSLVLDVGGYEGQWSSDIFSKYGCNIHIFEPIPSFCENIRKRFLHNTNITVHEFGLASTNCISTINVSKDRSSVFYNSNTSISEIQLVDIQYFLGEYNILYVDLIKINTEGCEYEILERLLSTNVIDKFKDIQVQFHDFVPGAEERMRAIQKQLSRTHELTYQYLFVWENWRIKT